MQILGRIVFARLFEHTSVYLYLSFFNYRND